MLLKDAWKMEEAKSMPTIQVLDSAIVPERGMGRGTVRKGILAGISSLIFGLFLAFVCEYLRGIKAIQNGTSSIVPGKKDDSCEVVSCELEGQRKIIASQKRESLKADKQYS